MAIIQWIYVKYIEEDVFHLQINMKAKYKSRHTKQNMNQGYFMTLVVKHVRLMKLDVCSLASKIKT